jgi:three-Cys-motif partner protein
MGDKRDIWDINNRPSTRTKLEILKKVFDVWLTIWNKQNWVANEWYVVDLFAGRGKYNDGSYGSPLIFLENIANKLPKLRENLRIRLFFVEKDNAYFEFLQKNISEFLINNPGIESKIDKRFFKDDCNQIIDKIITEIHNTNKHPLFILIDPTGLQIKKTTIQKIVNLKNPKDIIFNYILEGVVRTSGVAKKAHRGNKISMKEIKTIKTLKEFIGDDVNILKQLHIEILEDYCRSLFIDKGLKVIAYDIPYPNRDDTLYYLLFASRKPQITDIVKVIYAKQKEKTFGPTLFGGKDFYINQILNIEQNVSKIKRKTLLYKTKVEYGNWTINHVVGCKHGCKFPCYAMMMAKKFGWVKNYEDWRWPRIVENSLELLEKEIPKYKNEIDFVHLCFMSDPFMYDYENKELINEIKELTLKIIERLNKEGIKVTTLTKGIYPDEILNKEKFLQTNEYGITLVSLNNEFKNNFEPFSAPYEERIAHLKKLSDNGLNTWVSVEPYPTPDLDNQADKIERLLEKISFVKKLIFGKLNYRRLTEYNNGYSSSWKNNEDFYWEMVKRVVNFCKRNKIKYHIKFGTPLSEDKTKNLFKG